MDEVENTPLEYSKELKIATTSIDGLLILDLPVHGDSRGWFKENWQRAKMATTTSAHQVDVKVPDFKIVQNNISFNTNRGTTRGIHAEPWDKYISIAAGEIFGAWVDLRAGSKTYGEVFTARLDPSKAIFVPRGVGNSFQVLADNTAYTYLVNAYWSASKQSDYTFVNLADKKLNINWPIPLNSAAVEISEKDKQHPSFGEVKPMQPKKTLVLGANGQLGRAVRAEVLERHEFPDSFIYTDVQANAASGIEKFDFADEAAYNQVDWSTIGTIINCAAYTAVDLAETAEGRKSAWKVNAYAPSLLAQVSNEYDITVVHISSDYVFDGQKDGAYAEDDAFCPLGIYAQTKAAGDLAISVAKKHVIIRSSWIIGDGKNFIRTIHNLAKRGVKPKVVDDQKGRITFTSTLAAGIFHILKLQEYGTFNLTNSGEVQTWCDVARAVFELSGVDARAVSPISTAQYSAEYAKDGALISERPANSALDLKKITALSFTPTSYVQELEKYMKGLL
ncbi:MAG: bifunctional dTDP-4-dehydrorhamnose 3,5-epimerase family protein/NAD(P)-dependent oxidoreductase [Candidatus Ancillula trichonymphae]|jgi:dTDP-4-dehydrorhamnose 3,5-epimerase|nr:bifunctional dTDP-4-dehydrorhamnose 3,5-epimerase family protein/NAD(P)-dependent oxidoreductase [Candidatus Ancillula trichonymphae]